MSTQKLFCRLTRSVGNWAGVVPVPTDVVVDLAQPTAAAEAKGVALSVGRSQYPPPFVREDRPAGAAPLGHPPAAVKPTTDGEAGRARPAQWR